MTPDTRQADRVRAGVPSLFEIFCGKVADGYRQIAKWRKEGFLSKAGMQRRRAMRLEALEPRVLLSADLAYSGAAGTAMDAALRVADIDGAQMLQLVDNASSAVLAEALLDQDINVSIYGSELNDRLRIDFDSGVLAHQINVNFDGGDGDDMLTGPVLDSTWFIDDENSGRVGSTSFTGVENLEGAADNEDTFIFEPSGSLSGVADGGAGGFDSLVVNGTFDTMVFTPTGPHSGYVGRDGDVIAYAGLEPVSVGDPTHVVFNGDGGASDVDTWILEDSPTPGNLQLRSTTGQIETTQFAATAATITLHLGTGNDSVTIVSPGDSGFIGSIIVNGDADDDTLIVSAYTGNVTFAGGGGNNTIAATKNQNFILTNSSLSAADGLNVGLTDVGAANLTGGAGANSFTVSGWTGIADLSGLAGNDTYAFGPGSFGTVTIDGTADSGIDTLDFTALGVTPGLTVTNAGATLSKGVDTITQTGGNAEEIEATLVDSPVDLVSELESTLDDLLSFVRQMKDASGDLQALRNQLPLLDRGELGGLADVVGLISQFEEFVDSATAALDPLVHTKLSDVVRELNELVFSSDLTLKVSTSYRGEDPDVVGGVDNRLELLLDFELDGTKSEEFEIDLGETAQNIGATLEGKIVATGTLDADFSIGLSTGATPTAFLVPEATIGLEVAATTSPDNPLSKDNTLSDAPINLPSLELKGSGDLTLGGRLVLTVLDNDGQPDRRIHLGAFTPSLVHVGAPIGTLAGGKYLDSTVTVVGEGGVEVDGVDLSEAHSISFVLKIDGDAFGVGTGGPVKITPEIKAKMTEDGGDVDLLDFGNISAAEILGMLQQVSDLLNGISDSEFLTVPIPFTDLTLGGALDIGLGFKRAVIDPLFKSGDSLKPDNNGDGAVDASDLNFTSIQQLGKHLARTLGFDVGGSGGETSNLSFTPQYLTAGNVAVRAKTPGDDDKSVQIVTVQNAKDGEPAAGGTSGYKLRNDATDVTTARIAWNASADEVKAALNLALGAGTVTSVIRTPKGPDWVYEITFATDPGVLLESVIKEANKTTLVSAGRKELSLRIEYTPTFGFGEARVGTSLEGGNDINEKQTVTLNAVASAPGDGLDDTFQLGLRLGEGTPLLFTSDIAWNATVAQVEAALEHLGMTLVADAASPTTKQTLGMRNTGGGDFTLKQGTKETDPIAFGADFLEINRKLDDADIDATATGAADGVSFTLTRTAGDALTLGTIRSQRSGDLAPSAIDVSVTKDGKVYTVLFDQGVLAGTNVPQMVSDSSELLGALVLDFGTSLGDLATLKTEGSFSAIAQLTTGITFGLDLNPSQNLAIAPIVFAPGPTIELSTVTAGDGNVREVQRITIRNTSDGTFTLTHPASGNPSTTQPIQFNAAADVVKTQLNSLAAFSAPDKNVEVVREINDATGTVVYTITFAKASGNVPELKTGGTLLKGAAHNGKLAGTNPAVFTVEVLNSKFDLAGGGVVRSIGERSLGSLTISVDQDLSNTSLADLRDDVAREINEALKAFGLGFFDTDTGTLSTGAIEVGGISTASGAPLANLHNDIEFTLQSTQKVDSGTFGGSDSATTLNRAGGFSNVKVGDQVWNVDDGSRTTVKAIGETTITIGTLTGGGANAWIDGDAYEIRRPTEVTGRLRAVDMLDRSTDVLVAAVGQLGVQTVTIKDGAQGSFVLGLGSLLTRDISVDAPVDRPFAAVDGTGASRQLILERAEDGTFDLELGGKKAVNLAFNITASALQTKLKNVFDLTATVERVESGDTVTYTITFAADPGALSIDGTKLRGSSIEEALAGFDVQSVSDTTPAGSLDRRITITFNTPPGELLRAGNGTLLDANGALEAAEADRTLGVADYVGPLQRAIDAALERLNAAGENAALASAVFLDFAVKVEVVEAPGAQTLQLTVSKVADPEKGADTTAGTLELRFRSPVQADAGGGKITLSTSPALYSTNIVEAATRVERSLEISTEFDNAAYQQLGLLTAPTRFDGTTTDRIRLQLQVTTPSGSATHKIDVDVAAGTRSSIDKLVEDLQTAVNDKIAGAGLAVGDITVERTDPEGNRIQFVAKQGSVKTIAMFVDPAFGADNGAITELGFKAGQGDTKRAKSAEFFIEDAIFDGSFALIADDVAATATFGFLGIRVEGSGSIDASASVSEKTPGDKKVQVITLEGASGGTFRLVLGEDRTNGIAFNASASAVKSALDEAGISGTTVTGGNGGPYTISFATAPSELLEADDAGLEADNFLEGAIQLALKDPEKGGSRLTPGQIVSALGDGRILFDGDDLAAAGKTGVLDGAIAAELGFDLSVAPAGFLTGLKDDLNASLEIGIESPNWLVARPSISDTLGFGEAKDKNGHEVDGPIAFTGAADKFTLGEKAPESGELDTTLSFIISNNGGTNEAVGVLKKEDTEAKASASTTQQGASGTNEVQEIRVANASGGAFKITFDGKTSTLALPHNATVQQMETALNQVGFQSSDLNVSVSTEATSGDRVFRIEFKGTLAGTNVGSLGIAEDELTRTRADLQADLQAAIDGALVELGGAALKGKITATIDASTGEIALAGESGFSIRGNTIKVKFTGPDFDGLLARFKDLSFRDIIAGLQKAVEFLQSLDGSDGNPAKVPQLNSNLPLINRSVSDLLDPAKDFLEFVDGIAANPAGSVQQLNVILADALGFAAPVAAVASAPLASTDASRTVTLNNVSSGTFSLLAGAEETAQIALTLADLPALEQAVKEALEALDGISGEVTVAVSKVPSSDVLSSDVTIEITLLDPADAGVVLDVNGARLVALDILSLSFVDPANPVLNIDFGFGVGVNLSRPFDLDLADAIAQLGLPAFLTNLVGVDASGTLSVEAGVDLNLAFGFDLTGDDRAMYIRTADTGITARAEAVGTGLEFGAKLGPFGLFVVDGEAGINGLIDVGLLNADGDGRLVLVDLDGDNTDDDDLDHLGSFFPSGPINSPTGITVELTGGAELPLFIGTEDNKLPLDFGTATPGTENSLIVSLDAVAIFDPDDGDNGIDITFPQVSVDFLTDLEVPSLFALLSDPAVVIDGLDRLLLTLQEALNGQIMGVELPFVGDLLADNPAANIIGDFRDDLLKPLARTIRENNLDLDGLIDLFQDTLFDVLGPTGPFARFGGLLKDSGNGGGVTVEDIVVVFLDAEGDVVTPDALFSNVQALQFDFDLGKSDTFTAPEIEFDLGVPALGIEVDLQPRISIDFNLHIGFGVDQHEGFYFVTDFDRDGDEVPDDELSLDIVVDFGSTVEDPASATGRLVVLALMVTDGVDTDGDGELEFSNVTLHAGVDLADPNDDGRLTFPEMTSGSLSDIFVVGASGKAELRLAAEVDFSTLDPSLASVLPSLSTDILVDFSIDAVAGSGITVHPPEVAFIDVTLDLGSFISDFAGPVLEAVGDVLGPLEWLIGPDGFLNKRIPLLSDLLGKTVTGKDLIVLYDPKNGPKVVAFLDFVEQLYFLTDLVTDAAAQAKDGSIMINFGDVVLFDDPGGGLDLTEGGGVVDQLFSIGLPSVSDLRDLKNLKDTSVPAAPKMPDLPKATGSKTSEFTKGVTKPGAVNFPLLKPENVFKLLMGQTVSLVEIQLPELGFEFFYRQTIPIWGPIVGFFSGKIGGTLNLGFGYDTLGLEQFLVTDNPANLINGFFLNDLDPVTGFDRPEAELDLEIAIGAGLSLGFITAGVEGGFGADIDFNLSDLNDDGKVRFDELAGNIVANSFNPLAIFDISGKFDLFLRAFYEINLGLFSISDTYEFARVTVFAFDIPFERPSILAVQNGDVLTLNVGSNSAGRLQGDIRDISESITVETKSDGSVVVWSNQFNVNRTVAGINPFVGVKKIVADGGAGNDFIDLSGVVHGDIEVEIHGGEGNDTLIGSGRRDVLFGDGGNDTLEGGPGADELHGGAGNDVLRGGDGADLLFGEAGADNLNGGLGADSLDSGPGDDQLNGGGGDDFYVLKSAGSIVFIDGGGEGLDVLDFRDKSENVSFFLRGGQALAGWGARTGTFTNPLNAAVGSNWLEDFDHMVVASSLADLSAVYGGRGADTFHVYETRSDDIVTLLDGKQGSDSFIFYAEDGTPIDAFVSDNGNDWDLRNAIEVRGTDGVENVTVTANDITVGTNQVIRYESPLVDENALQIKIKTFGGDDHVNVASTSITVPVKVFAGSGDDTLTVGDGVVDNINAVNQPGLEQPFGLGPLVLIGEAGHDTVIIDDSLDSNGGDTGYLTSFLEPRQGSADVEVGVVNGLGMTLNQLVDFEIANDEFELAGAPVDLTYTLEEAADTVFVDVLDENDVLVKTFAGPGAGGLNAATFDGTDFAGEPLPAGTYSYKIRAFKVTPGRVEFEGFEAVDVRLGLGADTFRVGVEDIFDQLPLNRQEASEEDGGFTLSHTINGMTTISGGGGADSIAVEATNTLDRDALNAALGVVSATTLTPGVAGTTNEVQKVFVNADVGTFTLKFRFMETAPIAFDASALEVKQALEKLFIIGENSVDVTKVSDGFEIEFVNDLRHTDVAQLVARVTPLAISGGDGSDLVLVEAINQDMFFRGGGGDDTVRVGSPGTELEFAL